MVIADRDEDLGAEVVSAVQASGGQAEFVATDVSEEQDAKRMVDVALERFGRLDLAAARSGGKRRIGEMLMRPESPPRITGA